MVTLTILVSIIGVLLFIGICSYLITTIWWIGLPILIIGLCTFADGIIFKKLFHKNEKR